MDNNLDLTGLRTQASNAYNNLGDLQTSIPGMLQNLKSSLTSVFAKDNPYLAERNKALETFLNTPTQTRTELMPQNLPIVAGTNLTLSPTQQDAITTARSNAALVPLLGLNQTISGLYGNIGDIVQGAASTFQAQENAAKTRATLAQQLYETAIKEYEALTNRQNAGWGAGFGTFGTGGGADTYTYNGPAGLTINQNTPGLSWDNSGTGTSNNLAQSPTLPPSISYNNPGISYNAGGPSIGLWDFLTGLIGATPRYDQPEQPSLPQPTGPNYQDATTVANMLRRG